MRQITTIILILLLFTISCNQQIQDNNKDLNDNSPQPTSKLQSQKQELPKQIIEKKTKELEIPKQENTQEPKKQPSLDQSVVGVWRPHEQDIKYDAGGTNSIERPVTRRLTISSDGTWEFGSKGTWEVKPIEDSDWKRWDRKPYGPKKKIVLHGWNNAIGDGPIDEGTAGVDFIFIIYHSDKLSLGPARIYMKFGH